MSANPKNIDSRSLSGSRKNRLWKVFEKTGSIRVFLDYSRLHKQDLAGIDVSDQQGSGQHTEPIHPMRHE